MGKTCFVLACVALAAGWSACTGSDCGEPLYEGVATDEAWRTMVDAQRRVMQDDARAATVISPAEGDVLDPAGGPASLQWTSPLSASLPPRTSSAVASARRRPHIDMLDWILPSAWAHLPPVTGAVHLVEIPIADRGCPVQLLTTLTRWDMDSASWDMVRAQRGRTLELMITSAYLTENRITEGPYRPSAPRKFEVAP